MFVVSDDEEERECISVDGTMVLGGDGGGGGCSRRMALSSL